MEGEMPVRAWAIAALVVGAFSMGSGTAAAQPAAPTDVCAVADKRLAELSGIASDGQRWYAVNDGGTKSSVYVLGRDCAVQRVISGPTDPFDVEDLALGADGTFWLADTGDNGRKRETVALIALTPRGGTTLFRLTYPDGPQDTEALLLDRTGTPYLVTKNPLGTATVYRPAAGLVSPGPTALENVGTVRLRSTDTQGGPVNPLIGSVVVTGGAVSADGTVVALRTYTDAYLYAAPDGDVLAALGREPVRVPLPGEPQGEAIALEPDGTLISASEGRGSPIRAVPGATGLVARQAPTPAPEPQPEGGAAPAAPAAEQNGHGLSTLPALGFTAAAIGAVLVVMHRRTTRKS